MSSRLPTPNLICRLNKSPSLLFPATAILMNCVLFPHTIRTILSPTIHPAVQHPKYCDSHIRSCGIDFISSRFAFFGRLDVHSERFYFIYYVVLSGILHPFGGNEGGFFLHNINSRHEQGNHQPSSCFCRIMAACCSFVRWNSVPDCCWHRHEIREFLKVLR